MLEGVGGCVVRSERVGKKSELVRGEKQSTGTLFSSICDFFCLPPLHPCAPY